VNPLVLKKTRMKMIVNKFLLKRQMSKG
jgi:hypothetical protein